MAPRILATILLLAIPCVSRASDRWPGWRGPTGMGQTDEANLLLSWNGKTLENVRWKVPLFPSDKVRRDQNQSSPIVWGERVFVTVSYWPEGVSDKDFPEHHVYCFSSADGRRLWDTVVAPGPWKLTDLRGGYTAPTPACDGERVYVVFGSAVIAALDVAGKLIWRQEIKPYAFDVAIGASPVVYRDTVLFLCDQMQKSSRLLAFDVRSGKLRWQQDRPSADWAHSTPALAEVAGKTQLLVGSSSGPQGLNPENGEVLWSFKQGQRVGDTVTPVLGGGLVYVDSGRGGTGLAVDPSGSGDVSKTHLRWTVKNLPEGFSSPVVVGPYLYRLNGPGVISCLKIASGELVYKERLEGLDPAISPIATPDGRIYCAGAGKSFVLKAGPQFEVLARNDLGDPSRASAAVAAGCIYLKGGKYLFCVGAK